MGPSALSPRNSPSSARPKLPTAGHVFPSRASSGHDRAQGERAFTFLDDSGQAAMDSSPVHHGAAIGVLSFCVSDAGAARLLALVEVLEEGSWHGKEHAVGALLTLCESDRSRYRDVILKEGVIPGLLELTVHGTPKSRSKARQLLKLQRNAPYQRSELEADALQNLVCNIVSRMDGEECAGEAKKMLADMVQVSMEQSLRHLQQRALVCIPSDLP
ncbi:U-box domain-containing protein 4 [Apostasia shenzhenica]|uniref:U-box domain-containing protein 4 n=1 Tax=Apostasia shenzhenica TaxID=1088818 RepID=A0A2I0ADZ8_9ASPA|nr:U-box domain-containing protein 4 [Apostasia shenzhenica]